MCICIHTHTRTHTHMGFPGGSVVKNAPTKQEMQVLSLGRKDPLEKEMTTHSSILAWEIHGQRSLVGYGHGLAESDTN